MTDKEKEAIEYWKRELHCYEYTKDLDLASENYFGQFEEKINMISEILNLVKSQAKELEKKDKMIDLMIEEYEYNARINVKNFCEEELRKDSCIQDCRICIKQYFERKVGK